MGIASGVMSVELSIADVGLKTVCEDIINQLSKSSEETVFAKIVKTRSGAIMATGYIINTGQYGFIKTDSYNKANSGSFVILNGVLQLV